MTGAAARAELEAVLLVGHGAPARDTPRHLVRRLKALEAERVSSLGHGAPEGDEERALAATVRNWPRNRENDPYLHGLEVLAGRMRAASGGLRIAIAFNEMCAPTIDEALASLVAQGIRRVVAVSTMMTPGGVHAEEEIPEALARARRRFPDVDVRYAWPFDLDAVARLLLAHAAPEAARPATSMA